VHRLTVRRRTPPTPPPTQSDDFYEGNFRFIASSPGDRPVLRYLTGYSASKTSQCRVDGNIVSCGS
jgi:hypothetical protein